LVADKITKKDWDLARMEYEEAEDLSWVGGKKKPGTFLPDIAVTLSNLGYSG
jgi:hypothetical protein